MIETLECVGGGGKVVNDAESSVLEVKVLRWRVGMWHPQRWLVECILMPSFAR